MGKWGIGERDGDSKALSMRPECALRVLMRLPEWVAVDLRLAIDRCRVAEGFV